MALDKETKKVVWKDRKEWIGLGTYIFVSLCLMIFLFRQYNLPFVAARIIDVCVIAWLSLGVGYHLWRFFILNRTFTPNDTIVVLSFILSVYGFYFIRKYFMEFIFS